VGRVLAAKVLAGVTAKVSLLSRHASDTLASLTAGGAVGRAAGSWAVGGGAVLWW